MDECEDTGLSVIPFISDSEDESDPIPCRQTDRAAQPFASSVEDAKKLNQRHHGHGLTIGHARPGDILVMLQVVTHGSPERRVEQLPLGADVV